MKIMDCKDCVDHKSPAATFQNEKHGKGKRVFTPKKDGSFTCTVCGAKKSIK